jgi:hypothetical protein
MLGKRRQRIGFEMPEYYHRDTEIIGHILSLQTTLPEHLQRAGLYLAYHNKPKSMSAAKNERQLPNAKYITEEQFNESEQWIEQLGPKIDELYNSLSDKGKIRLDNEELTRKEYTKYNRKSKDNIEDDDDG